MTHNVTERPWSLILEFAKLVPTAGGAMLPEAALGKAIKIRRIEADFSQEQLAELCGIDRTYMSNIERGKRQPAIKTLRRIAIALNTKISALLIDAEKREQGSENG